MKLRINRTPQLMIDLKEVEILKQALYISNEPEVENLWQGLETGDVAHLGITKADVEAIKKDLDGVAKRLWVERNHARLDS